MRKFDPLPHDHPAARFLCAVCRAPLGVGAVTVLVPWGPAGIDDALRAARGHAHTAEVKPTHLGCLPDDIRHYVETEEALLSAGALVTESIGFNSEEGDPNE
jgi:hypothetical protein